MSRVHVSVAPEVAEGSEQSVLLPLLDEEINMFSKYMAELDSPGRGALNHPERALLKTYLVARIREKF